MKEKKISYCGDLCHECPRYKATLNDSYKELEYLAELWYRLGFRESIVDPEDMKCQGCSKEKNCLYGINQCSYLEGKSNCGECTYYPCDKIKRVLEKAEYYKEKCKEKCSDVEYRILNKAFFTKKNILENINQSKLKP